MRYGLMIPCLVIGLLAGCANRPLAEPVAASQPLPPAESREKLDAATMQEMLSNTPQPSGVYNPELKKKEDPCTPKDGIWRLVDCHKGEPTFRK